MKIKVKKKKKKGGLKKKKKKAQTNCKTNTARAPKREPDWATWTAPFLDFDSEVAVAEAALAVFEPWAVAVVVIATEVEEDFALHW